MNKLVVPEAFIDPIRIQGVELKNQFWSRVLTNCSWSNVKSGFRIFDNNVM